MAELQLPKLKKIEPKENLITHKNGDIRFGTKVIPKSERKTILLLSDDLRLFSGISTQSKELVSSTIHRYNWIQLGAAVNHPEKGKVSDMSYDFLKETGVEDASVKIIGNSGYGNANIIREILQKNTVDAIFHFTDPRQWDWLYEMEYEIHQANIPIIYLNIWDGPPAPMWNRSAYESCDLLLSISKQTLAFNRYIIGHDNYQLITHEV